MKSTSTLLRQMASPVGVGVVIRGAGLLLLLAAHAGCADQADIVAPNQGRMACVQLLGDKGNPGNSGIESSINTCIAEATGLPNLAGVIDPLYCCQYRSGAGSDFSDIFYESAETFRASTGQTPGEGGEPCGRYEVNYKDVLCSSDSTMVCNRERAPQSETIWTRIEAERRSGRVPQEVDLSVALPGEGAEITPVQLTLIGIRQACQDIEAQNDLLQRIDQLPVSCVGENACDVLASYRTGCQQNYPGSSNERCADFENICGAQIQAEQPSLACAGGPSSVPTPHAGDPGTPAPQDGSNPGGGGGGSGPDGSSSPSDGGEQASGGGQQDPGTPEAGGGASSGGGAQSPAPEQPASLTLTAFEGTSAPRSCSNCEDWHYFNGDVLGSCFEQVFPEGACGAWWTECDQHLRSLGNSCQ